MMTAPVKTVCQYDETPDHEAIRQEADDEGAQHRASDVTATTGQGGAANDDCRNRRQFIGCSRGRTSRGQLRGKDKPGDSRTDARKDIDRNRHPPHRNAG